MLKKNPKEIEEYIRKIHGIYNHSSEAKVIDNSTKEKRDTVSKVKQMINSKNRI